ncbi:MAG: tetratricopeptide repeat protein [Burkholderiales bacterium]
MPDPARRAPGWRICSTSRAKRSTARSPISAGRSLLLRNSLFPADGTIDSLLRSGIALLKQGQLLSAERLFRQSLAARADPAGWFHLGVAQHALRRLDDAARSFGEAIALAADFTEARSARATVLTELGRLGEAEAELRKALEGAPENVRVHHNLAVLLSGRGDSQRALEHYDRALALDLSHEGARLNRATLRLGLRDAQGALEDFRLLGDGVEAGAGRIRALLLLHRDDEALEEVDRLVARHPGNRLAARLKGIALASRGRLAEAKLALADSDESASARSLYIERALERQQVCDWRDRDRLVAAIRDALADARPGELSSRGVLFHAQALPLHGAELKGIAARFAEGVRAGAGELGSEQPPAMPSGARLRVGFLSSSLRNHPEARLLGPVLAHRDRTRFEYFLYALNSDDGSSLRATLAQSADLFIDASCWSSAQIVERIRRDRLHMLVDLSGNLEGSRPEVLAARVAPLQSGLIGPPATLGPGLLDYRLSDAVASPPAHQADWYERFALLPAPHWTYDVSQVIGGAGVREAHGLPARGFVYCCFNQAFKISPEVFGVWMRLLRQTPDSVLWLMDCGPLARANLSREARHAGVDAGRLVFAPRRDLEAHLGRQSQADLFLDTLNCGAHTTAADALHAGLPVLTRPGDTMASRLCAALVHGAGLPEFVVNDLEAYESKALELAGSPALLAEAKARLLQARSTSPFFATHDRVRAIERAFEAMIERQRAGLAPAMLIMD